MLATWRMQLLCTMHTRIRLNYTRTFTRTRVQIEMKHELGIAERLRALARLSDIDERVSGRRDVSRYEDGTEDENYRTHS